MRVLFVFIFSAFLGLLNLTSASAQTSETGLGALLPVLPETGQDDVWRFTNTGTSFEIENIGNPGAIRYYFTTTQNAGQRRIEAGLNIHPDSSGAAGILYGLNDDRSLYHVLTLDARGVVSLYRRDDSGFNAMVQQSSGAYLPGKINRLTVEENGNEITYSLNGKQLGSFGGELFGFGRVGIAAIGNVRAFFNYYSDGSDGDQSWQDGTEQVQQAAAPAETLHMRPVQITDAQGRVAYQTLIPEGWTTQGGVMWSQQDGPGGCFTGARLIWGTGTEDNQYGLAFLDPMSWGMSSIGPSRYMCLPQDLTDAEAAMRAYFQAISSMLQVSIVDVQRPPEIQPLVESVARALQASWPNARTWADGVVITATTKSSTGENDGYILAVTRHVEATYGGTTFRDGRTAMILGAFTPPGKLEEGHPAFGPILNNLRINPQWQQVEAQWWANRLRQAQPQPGTTATATGGDTSIGDMMFESWKRREGMQDAGHAKSVNGIWEVQPWQTPSGNTVLLNQNYNHAWHLQNGGIVLTNNANFNPMQSLNQFGQEMQRSN